MRTFTKSTMPSRFRSWSTGLRLNNDSNVSFARGCASSTAATDSQSRFKDQCRAITVISSFRLVMVFLQCLRDPGIRSGKFPSDSADSAQAGLCALRQNRASGSTESADRTGNGRFRISGARVGQKTAITYRCTGKRRCTGVREWS
jgi:hypothetical protein